MSLSPLFLSAKSRAHAAGRATDAKYVTDAIRDALKQDVWHCWDIFYPLYESAAIALHGGNPLPMQVILSFPYDTAPRHKTHRNSDSVYYAHSALNHVLTGKHLAADGIMTALAAVDDKAKRQQIIDKTFCSLMHERHNTTAALQVLATAGADVTKTTEIHAGMFSPLFTLAQRPHHRRGLDILVDAGLDIGAASATARKIRDFLGDTVKWAEKNKSLGNIMRLRSCDVDAAPVYKKEFDLIVQNLDAAAERYKARNHKKLPKPRI